MSLQIVNPDGLGPPSGFNHGMLAAPGGRVLFVAGQPPLDPTGRVSASGLVDQWDRALARVVAVVRAAGGSPEHITRLTVYVTDLQAYRAARRGLGAAHRRHLGRHYPAATLVQVTGLVDEGALVEIEATAVLP